MSLRCLGIEGDPDSWGILTSVRILSTSCMDGSSGGAALSQVARSALRRHPGEALPKSANDLRLLTDQPSSLPAIPSTFPRFFSVLSRRPALRRCRRHPCEVHTPSRRTTCAFTRICPSLRLSYRRFQDLRAVL